MFFPIFVKTHAKTLSFDSSLTPPDLICAVRNRFSCHEDLYITTSLGKNIELFEEWRDVFGFVPSHLTLNANFRLRGGGVFASACRSIFPSMGSDPGVAQSWNDDAAWAQEDDILVEIVERRRTRSKLSYDDIVMKWREEEWNSIRNELRRLSNSKKKRTWKDVKNRFRKVIVKKYDAMHPITSEDMKCLRERKSEVLHPIIEKVLNKRVDELTVSDLPEMDEDQIIKAQGIYASGRFDTRYGLAEEDWDALDEDLKNNVISIRNFVWSYAHVLKSEFPQGSLMRNFWTHGVIRKELLIKYSLLYYCHRGGQITPELEELLSKMKTF